jgi:DNA-binding response OmpR family regulator
MRILVVEDDQSIAEFLDQGLREAGHAVEWAADGRTGLQHALADDYDVLVLDVLLPKLDGLGIVRELRQRGHQTPILLLTALDAVGDRVNGLNAGADDYLVKPFAFDELLARVNALARRPPIQSDPVLRIGQLEIDTTSRLVHCQGRLADLSPREYALLEYLARNAGQALSRTQIAARVWGFEFAHDSNVVDVYIGYLRRKLDTDPDTKLIHTVRGIGFRLSPEPRR